MTAERSPAERGRLYKLGESKNAAGALHAAAVLMGRLIDAKADGEVPEDLTDDFCLNGLAVCMERTALALWVDLERLDGDLRGESDPDAA